VTLVLDGELHERGELRRTAGAAPPEDDAALLLRAYERLGSGLFSSLRGNFSLTIWDASDSTLLSLRDPMGTRPLFYSVLGRGLLLSPFIDALLQHPDVPSTVDRVVAAGHLLSIAPGPEETMFEAVRRLPAGRLMRFRAGVRTMTRYWDPEARSDLPATAEAQTEQFEHLLHQAVRRCLEPARSAISLSGGLDSATVAAAAVRVSEKLALPAPVAVSFFNPTADANEETTQRRVAAGLGLNQIAGAVDDLVPSGDPLRASLRLAKASATPPALLASASDALCARAARQGCRVILTGDGGDEWLLPAPVWAADRMLRLDLSGLRRLYRAWYHYFPAQRRRSVARGVLWHWGARPLLRGAVGQLLARWAPQQLHRWRTRTVTAPMPGWVAPDPRLRRDLVDWVMTRTPVIAPSRLYEETRREWLEDASFSLMMEEAFSSGVRLGMRTRMPLMDPDLISLLYRLPQGDLLRGGQAKAFAREYLSSSLDFAHSWPRTIYADSVWDATMATEGGDAWRELGGAPTLSDLGLIDGCAVDGFMRAHRAGGPIRRAADVWEVMSLESWLRGRASADFGNPG
jgi:asparagine synthetase B (glutamine-hydrolysing)